MSRVETTSAIVRSIERFASRKDSLFASLSLPPLVFRGSTFYFAEDIPISISDVRQRRLNDARPNAGNPPSKRTRADDPINDRQWSIPLTCVHTWLGESPPFGAGRRRRPTTGEPTCRPTSKEHTQYTYTFKRAQTHARDVHTNAHQPRRTYREHTNTPTHTHSLLEQCGRNL